MLRRGKASPVSDCYLSMGLFLMAFLAISRPLLRRIATLVACPVNFRVWCGLAGTL
jgi:hypothetical protein